MKLKSMLYIGISLSLILLGASCPYSFTNQLPSHLKTVSVPLFEDNTYEFGLKERLTNAVIDQFMQSNVLKVTDLQHADSVFKCNIKSYKKNVYSYDSDEKVKSYELTLKLEIEFRDIKKDKVIYKNMSYIGKTSYSAGGSEDDAKLVLISDTAKKIVTEAITQW